MRNKEVLVMNYYAARQHQETKKWKYTMANDGKVYEVGYCAKKDCPGHDTPEEAQEHYKQYMLDNNLQFHNPEDGDTMHKCKKCGTFTFGFATIGPCETIILCTEHQTREVVSEFYKVGESWGSY
jgi:hypothetical protein